MPLVVIAGTPCSGKSTVAQKLIQRLNHSDTIFITDEDFFSSTADRNSVYQDASKEKQLRGFLKSAVQRSLRPNNLVVLDSANYIKGFRYELYCLSKEHKSTHCVVQVTLPKIDAFERNFQRADNQKYDSNVFDALLLRYESPQANNRWDSPLFNTLGCNLDQMFDQVQQALFDSRPPPPNVSTQALPTSASNFLHEVDQRTRAVVDYVLKEQQMGDCKEYRIPDSSLPLKLGGQRLSLAQLNKHRRLFLTFVKSHPVQPEAIVKSFVQYLNTSFADNNTA